MAHGRLPDAVAPVTARYEVWCSAHVQAIAEHAQPRYISDSLREAERLRRQADTECQADPPGTHYIVEVAQ